MTSQVIVNAQAAFTEPPIQLRTANRMILLKHLSAVTCSTVTFLVVTSGPFFITPVLLFFRCVSNAILLSTVP